QSLSLHDALPILLQGRMFGKGRNVIGTGNRKGRGLKAYTSSQESNAFRGLAATVGSQFQVTGFYSLRGYSASAVGFDSTGSPRTNGYHRTQNELEKKDQLKQRVWGGRAQLEIPLGFIGITGYRAIYSKYVHPGNRVYNQFQFQGRSASAVGFDYRLLAGPAIIFGEIGRSQNNAYGFVTGVESPLG